MSNYDRIVRYTRAYGAVSRMQSHDTLARWPIRPARRVRGASTLRQWRARRRTDRRGMQGEDVAMPTAERTLIIIKPDGVQRGLVGEMLGRLEHRGLKFVALKFMQIDRALA